MKIFFFFLCLSIIFLNCINAETTFLEGDYFILGGVFDLSISAQDTEYVYTTVSGYGFIYDGMLLNRYLNIQCQVDDYPETYTEFQVYCTDTLTFSQRIYNIPNTLGSHIMRCTAIDSVSGEILFQAVDIFERTSAGGGPLPGDVEPLGDGEEPLLKPFHIALLSIFFLIVFCVVFFVIDKKRKKVPQFLYK